MSKAVFRHAYRVTYADCAPGDHVYYSRYLNFLETVRGEFFRHLALTFRELQLQGTIFPVIECRMRYRAPARYDDVISIEIWVTRAGRVRLNFAYRLLDASGELVAEAETDHVCTGLDDKPKRLPNDLITKLQPYLRIEA